MAPTQGADIVKLTELSIPGLFLLESPVWSDTRGFFREWYKRGDFEESVVNFPIQQGSFSTSRRGVIRGLHYSIAPEGQAKLVTCVFGELDDVIVDIRVGSPTFGQVEVIHLAANEERSVLVPVGVAHGICVTSELAVLTYLLSSPFNAPMELEIDPFDPAINVPWTLSGEPLISEKDAAAPTLDERRRANELPIYVAASH
ncbi:MAG TPA: dTDP-4-dehydrorhamnose 3,5-epimerase family protein [Acidimicrobiales bacterium]